MYIYGIYCTTLSEVSTCDLEVLQVPAPLPHSVGGQGVARGGKGWRMLCRVCMDAALNGGPAASQCNMLV